MSRAPAAAVLRSRGSHRSCAGRCFSFLAAPPSTLSIDSFGAVAVVVSSFVVVGRPCRYDFQFYNRKRIEELFAKENATVGPRKDLNTKIKASNGRVVAARASDPSPPCCSLQHALAQAHSANSASLPLLPLSIAPLQDQKQKENREYRRFLRVKANELMAAANAAAAGDGAATAASDGSGDAAAAPALSDEAANEMAEVEWKLLVAKAQAEAANPTAAAPAPAAAAPAAATGMDADAAVATPADASAAAGGDGAAAAATPAGDAAAASSASSSSSSASSSAAGGAASASSSTAASAAAANTPAAVEAAAYAILLELARLEAQLAALELTPAERAEKELLLSQGYSGWSKRDFRSFVNACERHGRSARDVIIGEVADITEKSPTEVSNYYNTFMTRASTDLSDWDRIRDKIERGEQRIKRREATEAIIAYKVSRCADPFRTLSIPYHLAPPPRGGAGAASSASSLSVARGYSEEEDRFLVCMLHVCGYGAWDQLRAEIRRAEVFRFNWFMKSRNGDDIHKRCDALMRMLEREAGEAGLVGEDVFARGKRGRAAAAAAAAQAQAAAVAAATAAASASSSSAAGSAAGGAAVGGKKRKKGADDSSSGAAPAADEDAGPAAKRAKLGAS